MRDNAVRLITLALLCLAAGSTAAHTRSVSYSYWTLTDQGARARATISQLELTRLGLSPDDPAYARKAARRLESALRLHDADGACRNQADIPPRISDGRVVHRWRADCEGSPTRLSSGLFRDTGVAHTHFVTLRRSNEPPATKVLTPADHLWAWGADDEPAAHPDRFTAFLTLGVEHILTGWDHLVFLLALIVIAASLKEVALLATGFTLGHSITLAIAVLGIARPAAPAVEAFIALSIVAVALENGWRLDPRTRHVAGAVVAGLLLLGVLSPVMPWLVMAGLTLCLVAYAGLLRTSAGGFRLRLALTAAFGLFHGFGFAGVLAGMELPSERLALALLGFNLGVEAGQIALLTLAWPLLVVLRRSPLPVAPAATAATAGVGIFWYLQRLFG